ncbi:MAG: hypothetical protein V7765_04100 [Oleispira sp.]
MKALKLWVFLVLMLALQVHAENIASCPAEDEYLRSKGDASGYSAMDCGIYFQDADKHSSVLIQLGLEELHIKGAVKLKTKDLMAYRQLHPNKQLIIVDRSSSWQSTSSWCQRLDGDVHTLNGGVRGVPTDLLEGDLILSAREVALANLTSHFRLVNLAEVAEDVAVILNAKNTIFYGNIKSEVLGYARRYRHLLSQGIVFSIANEQEITNEINSIRKIQIKFRAVPERYLCARGR